MSIHKVRVKIFRFYILNPFRFQFKVCMILRTHTYTHTHPPTHKVLWKGMCVWGTGTGALCNPRLLTLTLSRFHLERSLPTQRGGWAAQNTPATIYPTPEFPMQKQVKTCSANSSYTCLRRHRALFPSVFASKTTYASFASYINTWGVTRPNPMANMCRSQVLLLLLLLLRVQLWSYLWLSATCALQFQHCVTITHLDNSEHFLNIL